MTSINLTVTEQRVARVRAEIGLADALVDKVLEPGVDYGLHPGTRSQALKDPGANTIINAFGCYPKAEVLYREVSGERISYVIDIALVSRDDGLVKATGCGAASTTETKYGYRWVTEPESYGYDRVNLRKKSQGQGIVYRIVNPEWSELENTILKMARKRAEVDAAMGLPGVSRFMAKMNIRGEPQRVPGPSNKDWGNFWASCRTMGLDRKQVHEILGVDTLEEWTAQGRTLPDAVRKISEVLSRQPEERDSG